MRNVLKNFFKEEFLKNNECRNIKSPENEVHFYSEPDSAKHGYKNRVHDELGAGIFVVAENVIYIMAEKTRYCHVKTVEKIRNGRALERKIKVLRKFRSKASSKSSCHIAEAGKIEENHHGKNNHRKPRTENGRFRFVCNGKKMKNTV